MSTRTRDYLVRTAAALFVCGAMVMGFVCGRAAAKGDGDFGFYATIVFDFSLLCVAAVCLWFVGMFQRACAEQKRKRDRDASGNSKSVNTAECQLPRTDEREPRDSE